tara:strand:+ start:31 stop:213 length:183 start_codon:yes stop_codon:yes gene_type:complete
VYTHLHRHPKLDAAFRDGRASGFVLSVVHIAHPAFAFSFTGGDVKDPGSAEMSEVSLILV